MPGENDTQTEKATGMVRHASNNSVLARTRRAPERRAM